MCIRDRYYSDRKKLWNAGGYFTFYGDKRYFNQKKVDRLKAHGKEVMDCEFLTGCFMCCRTELLQKYGLFTDKFFFGEDDFNFCMRMKKAGIKLGCALNAVLYHKVSSSMAKTSANDDYRNIVHFTNRIIAVSYTHLDVYKRQVIKSVVVTARSATV